MAVKLLVDVRNFYGFNTDSLVLDISIQVQRIKPTTHAHSHKSMKIIIINNIKNIIQHHHRQTCKWGDGENKQKETQ